MSWPTIPIGELVTIRGGGTPPRSSEKYFRGDIPWVTPKDMKVWEISDSQIRITNEAIENSAATLLPADTVLLVVRSGVLKHTAPIAINRRPVAINQDMKSLQCNSKLLPEFLARYLKHSEQTILSWVRATTADNYSIDKIRELVIPLPPLDEQRRIAAILDQADALRRKRRQTIELLDGLIVSKFLTMFSKPLGRPMIGLSETCEKLPAGWQWRRLQAVAEMKSGHTPSRKVDDYWSGGDIPWLTLGDIRNLDGKTATKTAEHITSVGLDNSSAVMLPKDTVCFARTASVGFVTVAGMSLATSQDFVNWICGDLIDPYFLMWAFIATRKELIALAPGSTHHTIYFRLFELLHMAVPPIELQKQFLSLAKAIETTKSVAEEQLAVAETLFSSLQDKAFGGEKISSPPEQKFAAE